jgi:hypothetical protein
MKNTMKNMTPIHCRCRLETQTSRMLLLVVGLIVLVATYLWFVGENKNESN